MEFSQSEKVGTLNIHLPMCVCVCACMCAPSVTCSFDVSALRNVSYVRENKLQAKQKLFALKNLTGSRVSIREFNRPSLMTVTVNRDH